VSLRANSSERVVETSNWNIAYTPKTGAPPQSPGRSGIRYAISSRGSLLAITQVVYDKDREVEIQSP